MTSQMTNNQIKTTNQILNNVINPNLPAEVLAIAEVYVKQNKVYQSTLTNWDYIQTQDLAYLVVESVKKNIIG